MKVKYTSSIAGAAIFITIIGIVGKGFGFLREVVFAGYYGLSTEFDLYLVGIVIPITINTIILFIAQNIFIPSYNKLKIENENSKKNFLYFQIRVFCYSSVAISMLFFLFAPSIISIYQPGVDEKLLLISTNVFRISSLTIPFSGIIAISTAYLQVKYDFKNPALAQLFLNIVVILMIILFSDSLAIYAIPIGFLLGTVLQTIFLVKKAELNILNALFLKISRSAAYSFSITSLALITIIETVGQFYVLADRFFFHQVDTGGIASLNYAVNIFFLPMQIFSIALTTVIFPKISEYFAKKSYEEFNTILNKGIRMMILIFLPIASIFFIWGEIIVKLLFERGKFLSEDTLITFKVLQFLAISLVFYSIYAILNKVFYTSNLLIHLLIISVVGISVKIAGNAFFVKSFAQNGLALSTTITFIFFFMTSIFILKIKKIYEPDVNLIFLAFATFINALLTYFIVDELSDLLLSANAVADVIKIICFLIFFTMNISIYDKQSYSYYNYLRLPSLNNKYII